MFVAFVSGELGQRVADRHHVADLERADVQSIDAAERHLAVVRNGDDHAGYGIDEDARLSGESGPAAARDRRRRGRPESARRWPGGRDPLAGMSGPVAAP